MPSRLRLFVVSGFLDESFLTTFSLRHATVAWLVVFLPVTVNLPRFTVFLDPNLPDEVRFTPCHFRTAGNLPAGGSRLPPGSAFSPGSEYCI
jgi:hypothetical protein